MGKEYVLILAIEKMGFAKKYVHFQEFVFYGSLKIVFGENLCALRDKF